MGFETSNELFINIKNPPVYDRTKSYFEQSLDVLQFYEEEWKKITQGVTIGGYFIHPWLYFHINHFKTPIPQLDNFGNNVEIIMTPPLDDNIIYITESYQEAKERNRILFLFGTRGSTKSVGITSLTQWTTLTRPNGKFSIIGGSSPDLKAISSLMEAAYLNVNPAFYLPTIQKDWDKYISLGYKEGPGTNMIHSEIFVTNVDKGSAKQSEKGAGLSPIGFIIDEAAKFECKKILESALPSFKTQTGFKLVPVLAATGGNNVLSRDAKELLMNPDAHSILPMNWDRLNRFVPEEFITWKEDLKSSFGTFFPGQMTYREAIPRVDKPLSEVLGIKNKELAKINVKATDWKLGNEVLDNLENAHKKEDDKNRVKMYYPRRLSDCFLTASINPFPVSAIERRIRELEGSGKVGKSIDIFRDGSKFRYEISGKNRAELHYTGKALTPPVIMFGEFPDKTPSTHMFAGGLDDYKTDSSKTTESWGAGYIIKRRNMAPNEPCETIAACYVGRPERHEELYKNLEIMYETWNTLVLIEGVDVGFLPYLRARKKDSKILAKAVTFADKSGKGRLTAQYGLYPGTGNNEYRFNLMIDFTWEEFTVGVEEDGSPIVKYGVDFIDDIDLLKEWLEYTKGGNFDRMDAFSHALVQAREMDKANLRPKENIEYEEYKQPVDYRKAVSKPYTFDKRLKGGWR